MTLSHHLDDSTLMRYASGTLDEAFTVVVASHLAMCETCRDRLRAAEELGGNLLDDVPTSELCDGAFERLMQRMDETDGPGEVRQLRTARNSAAEVPVPLQRYIGPSLRAVKWKTIAPGVRKCAIDLGSDTTSSLYMLKINPGKKVPEHGHGGSELTLVLSGAYRDELGRFGPGDVADLDEDVEHQPEVEPGEPCICLMAAEGKTRFKGLLSRALQPLTGL